MGEAAGMISVLRDVLPAAGLVLLAAAFLRGRAGYRREERELKRRIESYRR